MSVEHVVRSLLAELDILMNIAGFQSFKYIKQEGRVYLESGLKNFPLLRAFYVGKAKCSITKRQQAL